jgi:hypothetical protein
MRMHHAAVYLSASSTTTRLSRNRTCKRFLE